MNFIITIVNSIITIVVNLDLMFRNGMHLQNYIQLYVIVYPNDSKKIIVHLCGSME